MNNYLKVKDHPGYFRDPNSKAIVIDDPLARKKYQDQKKLVQISTNSVNEIKDEVNTLKSELSEIKSMLSALLSKG